MIAPHCFIFLKVRPCIDAFVGFLFTYPGLVGLCSMGRAAIGYLPLYYCFHRSFRLVLMNYFSWFKRKQPLFKRYGNQTDYEATFRFDRSSASW